MKDYSVDIHAHCTLKPFTHNYPGEPFNIWDAFSNTCTGISLPILRLFENTVRRGTQTALHQAANGRVKIVGVSLFTYEGGWIKNAAKSVISCLAGPSKQKLADIVHAKTNIYEDLKAEFNYLVEQMQDTYEDKAGQIWEIKFLTKEIIGKILNEDQAILTDNTIYLFINIEGIQTFGIPSPDSTAHDYDLPDPEVSKIRANIYEIKTLWPVYPQYITFCHHFANMLAGHARTVPPFLSFLNIDQTNYMYKGLSTNGKKVIFELLGDKERRILIDIKHFSARARRDYYEYLKNTFPGQNIPIICSHTGFMNKFETLSELINQVDDGSDLRDEYLLNWTINMCKEDLEIIQRSNGLIGVQIDLKRLVGKKYWKLIKKATSEVAEKLSCEIVWANIFTAIGSLNNKQAWDLLCIGSDYDGIVSFLPEYPTFAEFPKLKSHLEATLTNLDFSHMSQIRVNGEYLTDDEIKRLMFGYTAEDILDKIFCTNALNFWKLNFIEKT